MNPYRFLKPIRIDFLDLIHMVILFYILPLTIILALLWLATRHKFFGQAIGLIWISIFSLLILGTVLRFFRDKKKVTKNDIYGEYVVDRSQFSGKQSNWQYNHLRFEITKQNEFIFYETDRDRILKTTKGKIEINDGSVSPRIALQFDIKRYHIIEYNPTLYRKIWSFYYVFQSPKFGNVFFTKGEWKPIKK